MSDFYDDELRGALLRASGDDCDTEDAFGEVHRRVRRARRRRMDLVCALVVIAMFVTLGVAARSARHADGPASTDTAVPTLPSPTTTATSVAPPVVAAPSSADAAAAPPSAPAEAPSPPPTDGTAETASATAGAAAGASSSSPSSSADRTTSRTSPPKTQQTFSVTGGQVTVTTTNGVLTLVAATAASGYTTVAPWTSADRIQVGFHSPSGDSWIRVDLVNGEALATVGSSTDHTGSRRSIPSTTAPRSPTSDSSRPSVSYPLGRTASSSATSWPSYRRR
jgi:hypothetical protein